MIRAYVTLLGELGPVLPVSRCSIAMVLREASPKWTGRSFITRPLLHPAVEGIVLPRVRCRLFQVQQSQGVAAEDIVALRLTDR